ncbi:MAG: hypothetical protein JWR62_1797 [Modestobacter sp.]|nr:hypothetical protein [Modestobacter sp.]
MQDSAVPAAARPDRWPAWVADVVAEIDLDDVCERIVERDTAIAFPTLVDDEEFREHLRASVRENLRCLHQVLAGRRALDSVLLERPLDFARLQARLRIPQTALQRSYRVGFATFWEAMADQLSKVAARTGVSRDESLQGLSQLTRTMLDYQDHASSQVAEIHARVDDAMGRTRAYVRQGLVRELLRGEATTLAPSELITLDHDLAAHHVAVVLPKVSEGTAGQLMIGLRSRTGVRQTLVHPLDLHRTAVWLTRPGRWTRDLRLQLRQALESLGVEVSVSEPLHGLSGFREAFEQAEDVERVRRAWGRSHVPPVLEHGDVSLELLLLRDPDRARRFVSVELGALAAGTAEAIRLRETLDASFRCGSHVGTAQHLELHEHTVRNRLRRAEQHLGHPLSERRTELQVALRLQRLLGGSS